MSEAKTDEAVVRWWLLERAMGPTRVVGVREDLAAASDAAKFRQSEEYGSVRVEGSVHTGVGYESPGGMLGPIRIEWDDVTGVYEVSEARARQISAGPDLRGRPLLREG